MVILSIAFVLLLGGGLLFVLRYSGRIITLENHTLSAIAESLRRSRLEMEEEEACLSCEEEPEDDSNSASLQLLERAPPASPESSPASPEEAAPDTQPCADPVAHANCVA